MAGGASIILFILLKIFVSKTADRYSWDAALYYASFLVNYPHFAASYQLLYLDAGKDFFSLRTRPWFALRLWWAGLIVPLLLLSYFVFALSQDSIVLMGYMVNAMSFFVGWHYVKQIFGCVIVLSAARKISYATWERWIILLPLYSLWLLQYVSANVTSTTSVFIDIPYSRLHLPMFVVSVTGFVFIVSTLAMFAMFGWRFQQRRALPPLSATVAILSIYVWFMPVYSNPYFTLIVPFFHSLQYLLFVLVYKRNESLLAVPEKTSTPAKRTARRRLTLVGSILFLVLPVLLIAGSVTGGFTNRFEDVMVATYGMLMMVSSSLWLTTVCITVATAMTVLALKLVSHKSALWYFLSFIAQMLLLGALLFSVVPTILDILARNSLLPQAMIYNAKTFGASFYLFAFMIFVNIHHYFVDNVLWRRDNPNIRQYLFH